MEWILTFKAPKSLYVLLATAVVIGVGVGLLLGHILWA
jgi:type III secretory pathway component EscT